MNNKDLAGLYIHIPFCISKCAYCSFVSVPVRGYDDRRITGYMQRLNEEMDAEATEWGNARFDSLFIGGGTPSVLPALYVSELILRAKDRFDIDAGAEITVEANPESFTPEKAFAYADTGVNRLSFGVQSTHERELKLLGRPHTWEDAQNALDYARMAGIGNVSADLIYNLPGQRTEDYLESVRRVLDLGVIHFSSYALSLEEGTPLYGAVRRGELPEPNADTAADMWEKTGEMARSYGLQRYEISNCAKNGFRSRHNLHYWNQDGYLGLGVAAHSARVYDGYILRMDNADNLTEYIHRGPVRNFQRIAIEDMAFEYVMLKTRLCDGFLLDDFRSRFNVPFESAYGTAASRASESGMAVLTKERFCLTSKGLLMQNSVLQLFMETNASGIWGEIAPHPRL